METEGFAIYDAMMQLKNEVSFIFIDDSIIFAAGFVVDYAV